MVAASLVIIFLAGTAFGAALALLGRTAATGSVQRITITHVEKTAKAERRRNFGGGVFRGEYMPPGPATRPTIEWREAGSTF